MQTVMESSDGRALLTAIVQNPDDDTPRLVLADWLDDHGDPDRAAFVRAQCAAARLPDGPEKEEAAVAAAALLERHHPAWLADLGPGFTAPVFARGFVAEVEMTGRDFVRHAARLLDRTPLDRVRVVRPTVTDLRRLAASEVLGRVPRMDLSIARFGDRGALALAESPRLKLLRGIDLTGTGIGAAGTRAVLTSLAGGADDRGRPRHQPARGGRGRGRRRVPGGRRPHGPAPRVRPDRGRRGGGAGRLPPPRRADPPRPVGDRTR